MEPFISREKERKICFEFHKGVDGKKRLLTILYIDHIGLKAIRADEQFARFMGYKNRNELLSTPQTKHLISYVLYFNPSDNTYFTEEPLNQSLN